MPGERGVGLLHNPAELFGLVVGHPPGQRTKLAGLDYGALIVRGPTRRGYETGSLETFLIDHLKMGAGDGDDDPVPDHLNLNVVCHHPISLSAFRRGGAALQIPSIFISHIVWLSQSSNRNDLTRQRRGGILAEPDAFDPTHRSGT
jgi:hypothetical protein